MSGTVKAGNLWIKSVSTSLSKKLCVPWCFFYKIVQILACTEKFIELNRERNRRFKRYLSSCMTSYIDSHRNIDFCNHTQSRAYASFRIPWAAESLQKPFYITALEKIAWAESRVNSHHHTLLQYLCLNALHFNHNYVSCT